MHVDVDALVQPDAHPVGPPAVDVVDVGLFQEAGGGGLWIAGHRNEVDVANSRPTPT